ncbi:Ger(x)C family spore germination protein [Paraliobacillus ryukyuensis]|uniref:Ger(x)C family spore germination protein n=1 Tax=Paraliobacillus ryukyuensis TaxID=200904 RepID=UPI00117D965C|nr:Ger(x)C family spore germination protein [Paraliobacillus ryukyuensis]
MKRKQFYIVVMSLFFLCVLSGCWDNQDIEELTLVLGMGFDLSDQQKIKLIYQIPTIISSTESGSGQSIYQNYISEGEAVHEIIRDGATKLPNPIYTHHLKVIIIDQELAENYKLSFILDQIFRDNVSRLSPKIFLTDKKAEEILNVSDDSEIPSVYIDSISDNEQSTMKLISSMSLIDLSADLMSSQSFLMPNVTIGENNSLQLKGAGVINGKEQKLIGSLNEQDLQGINWIKGEKQGGMIKIHHKSGQVAIYEVKHLSSKISPTLHNDTVTFDVKITADGWISEDWEFPGDAFDEKYIKEFEDLVEEEVLKYAEEATDKLQHELKTDVIGLGNQFRMKYPKKWEKIKKDWNAYFATSTINYDVEINVTNMGSAGSKK